MVPAICKAVLNTGSVLFEFPYRTPSSLICRDERAAEEFCPFAPAMGRISMQAPPLVQFTVASCVVDGQATNGRKLFSHSHMTIR